MLSLVSALRERDVCQAAYTLSTTFGVGGFGIVRRAVKKSTGEEFAVKCLSKTMMSKRDYESVETEINILLTINHPNVVRLYEVYDTPRTLYLVMEVMTGGELFDRIVQKDHYTELEAQKVIFGISSALDYCHERGIVHRDLKPENLLYPTKEESACIKIADFGLAKLRCSKDELMMTICGTPHYIAPEVIRGERYSSSVDMWSLGVILYILLCGYPPFYDENRSKLYQKICAAQFEFHSPYWDHISTPAKTLLRKLLVLNPSERSTPKEVLSHRWFHQKSNNDLGEVKTRMRSMVKHRLRATVRSTVVFNSMLKRTRLSESSRRTSAAAPSSQADEVQQMT